MNKTNNIDQSKIQKFIFEFTKILFKNKINYIFIKLSRK